MHRDDFVRLKRSAPPSDPQSEHELMVFSSTEGRAGQVDHNDEAHLFAWQDEITGGGGIQFDTAPQLGGWLSIRTNGIAPSTVSYTSGMSVGIWAHVTPEGDYPGGIALLSDRPDTTPHEFRVGAELEYSQGVVLYAHDGLHLWNSGSNKLHIRNNSDDQLWIEAHGSGGIEIDGGSGGVSVDSSDSIWVSASQELQLVGHGAVSGRGMLIRTTGGRLDIQNNHGSPISLEAYSVEIDLTFQSGGNSISFISEQIAMRTSGGVDGIVINPNKGLLLQSDTDNVSIIAASGIAYTQASSISFNSASQQVGVTTLADVIALLQSYGLAA